MRADELVGVCKDLLDLPTTEVVKILSTRMVVFFPEDRAPDAERRLFPYAGEPQGCEPHY